MTPQADVMKQDLKRLAFALLAYESISAFKILLGEGIVMVVGGESDIRDMVKDKS